MPEGYKTVLRRNLSQALGKGDSDEAALVLERLKEEDPLSVETRGLELEYLLRSERLQEAVTLADGLVKLFPRSPRIMYLAGRVAYRSKQYAAAEERLRESHCIYPHWRSVWLLGKTLTQQGKLDEAHTILESLLPEHAECYLDMAWLWERKQEYGRALDAVESYLREHPNNAWAQSQRVRLRARALDPQQLVEEADALLGLGEELPESVLPQYCEALFRTGQRAEVQQLIGERRRGLGVRLATSIGWTCYRFQAYDLAFQLFVDTLATNRGNAKFLAALELAATRSGRIAELISLYETHAPQERRLYGRLHHLRRRNS